MPTTIPAQLHGCRFILLKKEKDKCKEPLETGWKTDFNYAHDDPKLLAHINAGHNYGVLIRDGICVGDFDEPELYTDPLARPFFESFGQRTGREGIAYHLFFKCPGIPPEKLLLYSVLEKIPSRQTGKLVSKPIGDFRGSNNEKFYTVGPGSHHDQTDRLYTVIDPNKEIIEMPLEAVRALVKKFGNAKAKDRLGIDKPEPTKIDWDRIKRGCGRPSISDKLNLHVRDYLWPVDIKIDRPDHVQGVHPVHGSSRGKDGNNFSVNPQKEVWHCFACDSGGGPLEAMAISAGIIECGDARSGCLENHWPEVFKELERLGYDLKDIREQPDISAIISPEKPDFSNIPDDESIKMPDELLHIPGVLQYAVSYIDRTNFMRQPQFSIHAALAIGAVACGRRYVARGEYSNLYLVAVGPTSCGKNAAYKGIQNILTTAIENTKCLLGPGYRSEPGIFNAFIKQANHLTTIDEFGQYFGISKEKSHTRSREVFVKLTELYMVPPAYNRGSYSINTKMPKNSPEMVFYPSVSLFFTSTKSALFDSISIQDIRSGFIPRFLVMFPLSDEAEENPDFDPYEPVPDALVDWIRQKQPLLEENANSGTHPPDVFTGIKRLELAPGAEEMITAFSREMRKLSTANENEFVKEIVGKCAQNAIRVAIIVACSGNKNTILETHMDWAIKYVRFCTEKFIKEIDSSVYSSTFAYIVSETAQIIKKYTRDEKTGLTRREIQRKKPSVYKDWTIKQRDEAFDALYEDYPIKMFVGTRGNQKADLYYWDFSGGDV